ncbi:hypothetical protein HYH03_002736 [Edaphochlamys debaryana]|uniref:Kinesin motor domain-containing protein n=1 Tax=Edaphochlamys debaryana TaxID=47281 RepID=A0A835YCF6_9CHLO|nr:hypothetical protein HYH03_002736 [Edaphochlamys debaryana]|eukprot:KAG2499154.1 hypothetical protein HYH03_002736 [Edaphochlamys debaryana]
MVKDKQNNSHRFMFDQVLPENTTQESVFELAGVTSVDNCLAGYNSSIFAYGQTGAGKTFTVIGNIGDTDKRGLAPRVFEYLYAKITDHENARGPDTVKYNCRCAFLEIYNETIADLLSPSSQNLPIREDPEKGPYVEGLIEAPALNVDEMLAHLVKGAENRHTGETRLNRESSRSHSVFVCTIEKTVTSNGISKCFYARLNLVDLAGSERTGSGAHGGSNVTGEHFKEACHINKSLTALGRVTTELVKSQKNGGGGHVPYRDSKLTFLLQSSLGGNAKTLIIANVSPSSVCAHETLSTLRFAKQTKHIRNDAKVNWTVQGDRLAMQREIERLRMELAGVRSGVTEPLVQANEELAAKLDDEQRRREELQQERDRYANALAQARRENKALDQRLVGISGLDSKGASGAGALATLVDEVETFDNAQLRRQVELAGAEQQLAAMQLEMERASRALVEAQHAAAEQGRCEAVAKCEELSGQVEALSKEKVDLEEACAMLANNLSDSGLKLAAEKEQLAAVSANLEASTAREAELKEQLQQEREARAEAERQLAEAREQASGLQVQLENRGTELSEQGGRMEALQRQLEGALAEAQQLQSRLAEVQEHLAVATRDSASTHSELSDQISQLTAKLAAADATAAERAATVDELTRDLASSRDQLSEREASLEAKAAECTAALERLAEREASLAAEAEARSAAERQASSLSTELTALREQLSAGEQGAAAVAAELAVVRTEAEGLRAKVAERDADLEQAGARAEASAAEISGLTARVAELETGVNEQTAAREATEESLRTAEASVASLEQQLAGLRQELSAAQGEASAGQERGAELSAKVVELEGAKAELESQVAKQTAEAQERSSQLASLEHELAELKSSKAQLEEQLAQEQETVRETSSLNTELQDKIQQEEARALGTLREMSASAAASQRQLAELEDKHLQEVQALKDELDRRNTELKARDQEIIKSNFQLKHEIDRLQATVEQTRRELGSSKAAQEQMAASHGAMISGMNERMQKQQDRYNELSKKHDSVKQQLDSAQREIESWKVKCERLDHAMADVTRLIRFARNPPDSARSSLIMTRSDHPSPVMGDSRFVSGVSVSRGITGGAGNTPLSVRITESPAESPRVTTSRYSAASPAASKMGSVCISGSHRLDNLADDDGEEWSSRRMDVLSPGDQLPIPQTE